MAGRKSQAYLARPKNNKLRLISLMKPIMSANKKAKIEDEGELQSIWNGVRPLSLPLTLSLAAAD